MFPLTFSVPRTSLIQVFPPKYASGMAHSSNDFISTECNRRVAAFFFISAQPQNQFCQGTDSGSLVRLDFKIATRTVAAAPTMAAFFNARIYAFGHFFTLSKQLGLESFSEFCSFNLVLTIVKLIWCLWRPSRADVARQERFATGTRDSFLAVAAITQCTQNKSLQFLFQEILHSYNSSYSCLTATKEN